MANYDVTLNRVTNADGTADVIHPSTNLTQITVSKDDDTTLASYLSTNYIDVDQKGANNGVAPLGATGKISSTYLDQSLFGGLKYVSAITTSTWDVSNIDQAITDYADAGSYWVVSAETVTFTDTGLLGYTVNAPGDDGDTLFPITLEQGDWVVLDDADNKILTIMDFNYHDATTTSTGVIKSTVSDATFLNAASGFTSHAVTATSLRGAKVADNTDLGSYTTNDKLAPAYHNHDSRYYTETEISNFFSGTTPKTGYNNSNWDTAYDWGDHSTVGYLTSETSHADVVVDGDFSSQGIMLRGATAGTYSILTDNSSNWNTAYNWGDHSTAGYLTGITKTMVENTLSNVSFTDGGIVLTGLELQSDGNVLEFDSNLVYTADNSTPLKYADDIPTSGNLVGTIFITVD